MRVKKFVWWWCWCWSVTPKKCSILQNSSYLKMPFFVLEYQKNLLKRFLIFIILSFFRCRWSKQTSICARSITASHSQSVTPLQTCSRRFPLRHASRRRPSHYLDQRCISARTASDANDANVTELASPRDGSMDRDVRNWARASSSAVVDAIVEQVFHSHRGRWSSRDDHHVARDDRQTRAWLCSAGGTCGLSEDVGIAVFERGRKLFDNYGKQIEIKGIVWLTFS